MNRHRLLILGLLVGALFVSATNAFGCTVCFGESDHPIVKGAEASVLFMVIVTYTLLTSGVVGVILLRRRAKRLQQDAADASAESSHYSVSNPSLTADQGALRP